MHFTEGGQISVRLGTHGPERIGLFYETVFVLYGPLRGKPS
jgi:hypothetical protein